MEEIKIVSRFDNSKVLVVGKYLSIKDACEKNSANLRGANLRGANLVCANLRGANLIDENLIDANLEGANLVCANLRGAYLMGANLKGANLESAYLEGANLRGAYLVGATAYYNSHSFFAEVIRQQKTDAFTNDEWCAIGQIIIHTLCWDSIRNRFKEEAMSIFTKLDKAGFGEFLEKFIK